MSVPVSRNLEELVIMSARYALAFSQKSDGPQMRRICCPAR